MIEKIFGEVKGIFNTVTIIEIGLSIISVLLGLIFFTNTTMNHLMVAIITGVFLILYSVATLFSFFKKDELILFRYNAIFGGLELIVGILACALYKILPIMLGIFFIICCAQKVAYALCLKKYKESSWLLTLVSGLLIFALGIIVMFANGDGVISALGISYLGYGLLNIIDIVLLRKRSSYFLA